jgi:hypothetical protein
LISPKKPQIANRKQYYVALGAEAAPLAFSNRAGVSSRLTFAGAAQPVVSPSQSKKDPFPSPAVLFIVY